MPKRKFSRSKKRTSKKRSWKRKRTILPLTRRIRAVVGRMEETKFISNLFTQLPTSAAAAVNSLSTLQQGVTRALRLGNRISALSLGMNCTIEPLAAAILGTRVRVIVLVDKQPNGVAIDPLDLMQPGTASANAFYSMYNRNTVPARYRILKDKFFNLGQMVPGVVAAGVTTAVIQQPKYFKWRIPLKFTVKYNDGNAGTIADVVDNNLYVISYTSQGAAAAPGVFWQTTFTFKDA